MYIHIHICMYIYIINNVLHLQHLIPWGNTVYLTYGTQPRQITSYKLYIGQHIFFFFLKLAYRHDALIVPMGKGRDKGSSFIEFIFKFSPFFSLVL